MAVEDELAEVVENYVEQLRAMKRPAKEEINMLTMVAEQYMDRGPFALGLVQALERAIEEVTHKLFCEPRPSHIITWPFAIELSCASFMRAVLAQLLPFPPPRVHSHQNVKHFFVACNLFSLLQSANDKKLIPLYVMDSILKNLKPRHVYSDLISQVEICLHTALHLPVVLIRVHFPFFVWRRD